MKEKKVSLFLAFLGIGLMITSIVGLYTAKSNNEVIGAITAFIITGVLSLVAIFDYDYLSKKEQL